jgi:cytochrome c-type biogenesis protein CcmH/NrfG
MNTTAVVLTVVLGVAGVSTGSWVGGVQAVQWLDERYAPAQALEDLHWEALKKAIRELRDRVAANPDDQNAKRDLEDTLARFCKAYPEDRECE